MSAARINRSTAHDERKAYRYLLTDVGGSMIGRAEVGEHILDWTYFGRAHTWHVFDFAKGEETGFMHGVYVDKGYKVGDQYEPDADRASREAGALSKPESFRGGAR